MIKHIEYLLLFIQAFFFIPHYLLYSFSKAKKKIDEDVKAMSKYPEYSSMGGNKLLLYLLIRDKYFRKMFYTRIGLMSNLVSW